MVASTATFGLLISAKTKGKPEIDRLGNSMQGVQGKVKNLKMAVGGLSTAFKALGAALAVGAFARYTQNALELADAVGKLSTRTGIAANKLFAFQNAAELADVSNEQLTTGLLQLSKNMLEAARGTETYAAAFRGLGVQLRGADGQLRSADDVFADIADRFEDLPDGATKAAVAMRLFGRSGAQLIPLLNGGSEALGQFTFALSDEFTEKAQLFNDTMAGIGRRFREIQLQILDYFLPTFQMIGDAFADLFASSSGDWTAFGKLVEGVLRGVGAAVYATIAGIRFLSRVIGDLVRMTQAVMQGDLGKAGRIAAKGIEDTRRQAIIDRNNLSQMLGGSYANEREDRTGYSRRKTGGFFDLDSLLRDPSKAAGEKKTPEQKAAEEYEKFLERLIGTAADYKTVTIDAVEVTKEQITAFTGVKDAAAGYLESIGTMREGVANLATNAFQGLEDALVSIATTGKANFLEFAKAIMVATTRMIIQQTILRSIMSAIGMVGGAAPKSPFGGPQVVTGGTGIDGSAFGKAAFNKVLPISGFKAGGGSVAAGRGYIVGENGPEYFRPGIGGQIVPNHRLQMIDLGGKFMPMHPLFLAAMAGVGGFRNAGIRQQVMEHMGARFGHAMPRANGGAVSAGSRYLVGERGPEMFKPRGGGGVNVGSININVQNTGEQLNASAQKQIATQVQGIVMAALVNEQRSGGVLR